MSVEGVQMPPQESGVDHDEQIEGSNLSDLDRQTNRVIRATKYGDLGKVVEEVQALKESGDISQEAIEAAARKKIAADIDDPGSSFVTDGMTDLPSKNNLADFQERLGLSDETIKEGIKDGIAQALHNGPHNQFGRMLYEEDPTYVNEMTDRLESEFGITADDFADIIARSQERYADVPEIIGRIREKFVDGVKYSPK